MQSNQIISHELTEIEDEVINKVIEGNNIPDDFKDRARVLLTDILHNFLAHAGYVFSIINSLNETIATTKNNRNEYQESILALLEAVKKIKEIDGLTIDGFLKGMKLEKYIGDRTKSLSSHPELAKASEKEFLLGLIGQVKDLEKVYEKLKNAENMQIEAYAAYNKHKISPETMEIIEKEYLGLYKLIENYYSIENTSSFPSELRIILTEFCDLYLIKLDNDVKDHQFHKQTIIECKKSLENAATFIDQGQNKDFAVNVNGDLITLRECREKIELALNSETVKGLKAKLNQTNNIQSNASLAKISNPSSTSVINMVMTSPNLTSTQSVQAQSSSASIINNSMSSIKESKNSQTSTPTPTPTPLLVLDNKKVHKKKNVTNDKSLLFSSSLLKKSKHKPKQETVEDASAQNKRDKHKGGQA